jgi:hypothetical protein
MGVPYIWIGGWEYCYHMHRSSAKKTAVSQILKTPALTPAPTTQPLVVMIGLHKKKVVSGEENIMLLAIEL